METQYKLYQTLQDRNNHIECELEGPFPCEWENTWIGKGFYFWFHHLELALWWGNSRYSKKNFVVYESTCKDIEKCWDLHSSPLHQEEFMKWLEEKNFQLYAYKISPRTKSIIRNFRTVEL